MLTRCPRCDTTFRVTTEQLKARHGRVRCGHCQDVFNALDTLIEAIPQSTAAESLPTSAVEESALEKPVPSLAGTAASSEPGEPLREPAEETAEPAAPSEAEDAEIATEDESSSATPALEPLLHEEPRKRVWPWALGCVAALAALAAQAAIHYRTEISVLYPTAKPVLVAACAPLGCEVSLPRKPELVGIETSNLSPDSDGKLALSATLKNRAPFAQQFPDLEVTLTDTGDQALVRRVLAPADYLPAKTDHAADFAAGSEVMVNLAVEAPGVPASGYQLYLFYP